MEAEVNKNNNKQRIIYQRPQHFSSLQNLQAENILCDINIEVKGQIFHAHKCVLAASINYFKGMFINNFRESDERQISIPNVKAENMENFINFAYTGCITLTEDNVQSMLIDADYLDLIDIKDECIKFLHSCVKEESVFDIYYVAELLDCTLLMIKCKEFMRQHLAHIPRNEQFFGISSNFLFEIICDYDSNIVSPRQVYEAIMKWIKHDTVNRQIHLYDLLVGIGLERLSIGYLIDYVIKDELIDKSEQCRDFVNDIIYSFIKPNKLNLSEVSNNSNDLKERFFIMGIFDSRTMELYDPHTDTWETREGTHYPRKWYSCAVHDGELYIIGGKVDSEIVSSVRIYNPQRQTIRSISSMNTKLRYVGAAGLNNNSFVYVCGGSNATNKSNVVERYCPATDEWKIMSPMHVSREDLAVVAFQGYIYALGGCDEVSALDSVERYNPRIDQWVLLASTMNQKRFSFGAAVLDDKIYVCGGSSSKLLVSLNTLEVYDPKTNRWEYRASMNIPRWGMLLIASMGKLWAIGGWDRSLPLSTIEVYDPKVNVWTFAPSDCKIKGSVTGGLLAI